MKRKRKKKKRNDFSLFSFKKNKMIKAVIFDYDGVIVDSLPAIINIYKIILKELNLEHNSELIQDGEFYELDWRDTLAKLNIVNEDDIKRTEEIFRENLVKFVPSIKLFPQIKEVIRELYKHYKLAIISNNKTNVIKEKLKEQNLLHYFNAVIGYDENKEIKPHPFSITYCLDKLEVLPEETILIGDMDGDIKAAKSAGLNKVIGVVYGFHSRHRLNGADVIVDKPEDILNVIEDKGN
jgi:phosphoglycolate phosphatase